MIENKVFATTLNLLAAALNGQLCPEFDVCLWPDVRKELEAQGVLPLVSDMLLKSALLDKEEKQYLIKTNAAHSSRFFKIMTQQTEAVNLLEENHIPVTVLKGAACAQYYEKPRARQFGDIDLLVLPEDYNNALALFREKGYTQLDAEDAFYQRHIGFCTPSSIEIELHRFFSENPVDDRNPILDQFLFENLHHTEKVNIQQFSAPVLPSIANGIVILEHINHHLKAGLGLRQIADWMMYVKTQLNDDSWEKKFKHQAEAIGIADLAKTVTKMCQKYLDLTTGITWCQDADEELSDELLSFVLKKGNLGSKIKKESQSTILLLRKLCKPKELLQYLTESGMVHMHEAGIKPSKTFAPVYQLGYLLRKAVKHTNKEQIWKDAKNCAEDTALIKRLKNAKD